VLLILCTIGSLQVLTVLQSHSGSAGCARSCRASRSSWSRTAKLIEGAILRRERLTLDDLAEKARLSEIGSIDNLRWAVLETNGDISFIKKAES